MKVRTHTAPHRWLAAAALLLALTLIFTGCSDKNETPATASTESALGTESDTVPVSTEAPSLPIPDLTETCWDASFGQSVSDCFCFRFLPDGTFRHYQYSTKTLGDSGRYRVNRNVLELTFRSGESSWRSSFRWDGKGFLSTEEHEMAVGTGRYTMAANAAGKEFFEEQPADSAWEPSLNKTDISFFGAGEGYTLVVQGVPVGTEVSWSSEKEEIAVVDPSGHVTAVGPGSARIYAEVGEEKLTCWIRCQFAAPAGDEEPSLNKTDISFFGVGENYVLHVENVPEDVQVVWSSEDVYVASVDENGHVYAVGPGTIRIAAQVGDKALYCWVRCQFDAPAGPHSSVADGTWLVSLYKDRLTPVGTAPDRWLAEGNLLGHIHVEKSELDRLQNGSALDLTAFGKQVYRVTSARYDAGQNTYYVKVDGAEEMEFTQDDDGKWALMGDNGFQFCNVGPVKLAFDENSVLLDAMSATLSGGSEPVRVSHLPDYFEQVPGIGDCLQKVEVTVEKGVVTNCLWCYMP